MRGLLVEFSCTICDVRKNPPIKGKTTSVTFADSLLFPASNIVIAKFERIFTQSHVPRSGWSLANNS